LSQYDSEKKKEGIMLQMNRALFAVFIVLLFSFACAPTSKTSRCNISPQPEKVYTFSIPPESTSREIRDNKPDILKGFPFISSQPITNFKGKFPPEFYSDIKYRWNAEYMGFVDFWKLRYNQHLYDVIYINPMWIGDLSLGENDFLKNIVYSYNISDEQFKILDTWIKNKLSVRTFTAKKIDEFNTEKLSIEVTPESIRDMNGMDRDVKKLLLEQTDYIGIYITVDGSPIIKSGNTVFASYVNYGQGKILTLAPFDFRNVHYDGEIFRLDLLSWALNGRK
jgi:hypothetical protein